MLHSFFIYNLTESICFAVTHSMRTDLLLAIQLIYLLLVQLSTKQCLKQIGMQFGSCKYVAGVATHPLYFKHPFISLFNLDYISFEVFSGFFLLGHFFDCICRISLFNLIGIPRILLEINGTLLQTLIFYT